MAAHPETQLHISIVNWLRTVAPQLIIAHSPNGEVRDIRTASKLKAMGVYRGWPDLQIIDDTGRVFFLEIKAPKGRLSDDQRAFRDECEKRGIYWACVHSIDEARTALEFWRVPTREAA